MADLATAGTAHEANLTHAERREIVVQHEALEGLAGLQQFNALLVFLGAQRHGDQGLGLAASEQGRAVRSRQDAGLDRDGADLVEGTPVGTAMLFEHLVAENALLEAIEGFADLRLLLFGEPREYAASEFRNLR